MSSNVLCHACGEIVDVPSGHSRKKIRCEICGVMVDVPTSSTTDILESNTDDEAMAVWESEDSPFAPEKEKVAPQPKEMKNKKPEPKEPPQPKISSEQRRRQWTEEDENDNPYEFSETLTLCPSCNAELPAEAELCVSCGFDLKKKEKRKREYQSIERSWQMGWPMSTRRVCTIVVSITTLFIACVSAYFQGNWMLFLGPWFLSTVMLVFLLGTFNRVDLSRNVKGRSRITNTIWICFVQREPTMLKMGDFDGISHQVEQENGCLEWALLVFLLPLIIPGIIWWLVVMRNHTCRVSLTQGHGCPVYTLYWGFNEELMHEMVATIHEVTGLPLKN